MRWKHVLARVGLIVVVIALLYPVIKHRVSMNDSTSSGSVRTLNQALTEYQLHYGGYAPTLAVLGSGFRDQGLSAQAAALIDHELASGEKAGYRFRYEPGDLDAKGKYRAYIIHADPIQDPNNKQTHYFSDQTGMIRKQIGRPADVNSPVDPQ